MDETSLQLIIDLHRRNPCQGPGGDSERRLAAQLAGLTSATKRLNIADFGCGTGAATIWLADQYDAEITAVDLAEPFLEELDHRVSKMDVSGVTTVAASMDALPFPEDCSFDVIWSEGAVYNIGFARGVSYWRGFLKTGGMLIVSEITWLQSDIPDELRSFWEKEYPEIDTAAAKIAVLESLGFSPVGYFPLPPSCWQNYYKPLRAGFDEFLARSNHSEAAGGIVEEVMAEIALYEKFGEYFSYGFYVARKC